MRARVDLGSIKLSSNKSFRFILYVNTIPENACGSLEFINNMFVYFYQN